MGVTDFHRLFLLKSIFEFQWATENKGKYFVYEDFCNMNSNTTSLETENP